MIINSLHTLRRCAGHFGAETRVKRAAGGAVMVAAGRVIGDRARAGRVVGTAAGAGEGGGASLAGGGGFDDHWYGRSEILDKGTFL